VAAFRGPFSGTTTFRNLSNLVSSLVPDLRVAPMKRLRDAPKWSANGALVKQGCASQTPRSLYRWTTH